MKIWMNSLFLSKQVLKERALNDKRIGESSVHRYFITMFLIFPSVFDPSKIPPNSHLRKKE